MTHTKPLYKLLACIILFVCFSVKHLSLMQSLASFVYLLLCLLTFLLPPFFPPYILNTSLFSFIFLKWSHHLINLLFSYSLFIKSFSLRTFFSSYLLFSYSRLFFFLLHQRLIITHFIKAEINLILCVNFAQSKRKALVFTITFVAPATYLPCTI